MRQKPRVIFIAMSPIDVEQFNEEETFSLHLEEGISPSITARNYGFTGTFDEDAVLCRRECRYRRSRDRLRNSTCFSDHGHGRYGGTVSVVSWAQRANDASQSDRQRDVLSMVAPVGGSLWRRAATRHPWQSMTKRPCRSLRCFPTCYRASAQINLSVRQRRKRANNVRSSKPLVWNCLISTRAISSALRKSTDRR